MRKIPNKLLAAAVGVVSIASISIQAQSMWDSEPDSTVLEARSVMSQVENVSNSEDVKFMNGIQFINLESGNYVDSKFIFDNSATLHDGMKMHGKIGHPDFTISFTEAEKQAIEGMVEATPEPARTIVEKHSNDFFVLKKFGESYDTYRTGQKERIMGLIEGGAKYEDLSIRDKNFLADSETISSAFALATIAKVELSNGATQKEIANIIDSFSSMLSENLQEEKQIKVAVMEQIKELAGDPGELFGLDAVELKDRIQRVTLNSTLSGASGDDILNSELGNDFSAPTA
ncbi:hypothetical protein [Alteromonas antoniana]|uniref:hypothetical protein n=1 Tax=Alteromonas antoniana TaxID=2803813 RepID=UPI001C46867F|nr:hypothetical protein [Alteromonas antoniana]